MDKNKLVIAIGKMKPKGFSSSHDDEEEDKSEPSVDAGLEAAFDELVSALGIDPDKVDSAAGVEALEAFLKQCDKDGGEEEEESDSGF